MSSLVDTATFGRTGNFRRSAKPAQKETSGKIVWFVGAVLALAAVAALASAWRPLHAEAPAAPASRTEQGVAGEVVVTRPQPATTADVLLPATVRPWQATTLHARVTGYLLAWHVDLGDSVKVGQVLAELETPELDQEVAESQAQAQEAQAAAAQARAEYAEAEAALQASVAQLARVQAEVELARSQLTRRERLIATNSISQEERDTFQKQWEARTADVEAAQAEVAHRRTNLQTRKAVIEARQATAQSRLANVERLKQLQAFQRIVAPFDGVITERKAEVGMLVTAGQEPLFTVQDMSRVRVQVNVPQANAAQLVVGSPASLSIPESGAAPVVGEITRLASSIDSSSRTMVAEIELTNPDRRLQPGSYVQVKLSAPQQNTLWTVPVNTVQMLSDGPRVLVVGADRRIEARPVKLGRDLGARITVLEGIRGGESLVVNPGDSLSSGDLVRVQATAEVASR